MAQIIAHRGIDLDRGTNVLENSFEAFEKCLSDGFGFEFDIQFSKDKEIIIWHDPNLGRISGRKDTRKIEQIEGAELFDMNFNGFRFMEFENLMEIISRNRDTGQIYALHCKYIFQKEEFLQILVKKISKFTFQNVVVFDLKVDAAKYLKENLKEVKLAPSVSADYDILRYNRLVGGTLYTLKEILAMRDIFNWVWLDEWDQIDEGSMKKHFYTLANFKAIKSKGFKIALVTPELHKNEFHEDSISKDVLFNRIHDICKIKPDAICTDYPSKVKIINESL